MALELHVGFDIASFLATYSVTLTVHVVETGGATFDLTYTTGSFFMNIDGSAAFGPQDQEVQGYSSFLATLQSDLDAHTGSGSYAVSLDASSHVTIVHSGGSVSNVTYTWSGGFIQLLSLPGGSMSGLSIAGLQPPWYLMRGDVGFWSKLNERERGTVAVDVLGHDGTPGGLSRRQADRAYEIVVPLEPRGKVWSHTSSSLVAYFWENFFADARTEFPIAVNDGFDGAGQTFILLREDGCFLDPQAVGSDGYIGHYDIPIRARALAWST